MSQHKQVRLLFMLATIVALGSGISMIYLRMPAHEELVWMGTPAVGIVQAAPQQDYDDGTTSSQQISDQNIIDSPIISVTSKKPTLSSVDEPLPELGSEDETPDTDAVAELSSSVEHCLLPDGTRGVNLNTATLEELDSLPGIGKVIAQAILDARASRGGYFHAVEDLLDVKGIGPARFKRLVPYVCLPGPQE